MRLLTLTLAAVLTAAGAGRADDKATEIVKKSIEATGGAEALNKYKAGRMTMDGSMNIIGMDIEFTGKLSYTMPDRYKVDMTAKIAGMELVIKQTVNGKKIKNAVTLDGMKQPSGGETEAEELRFSAALQEVGQLTPLMDAKRFEMKALDDAEVNGSKFAVVEVKILELKKDCKLYFDKKTNLQVMMAHKAKAPSATGQLEEVDEESWGSDFKKVNGIMIPGKLLIKHDGKKFMEMTLKDYELLEKIDPKEFAIDD